MALNPTDGLLVYTDGSYCNKGPGGWSWVAVDAHGGSETNCGYIEPPTTNNRAEMVAVASALHDLFQKYGPCEIEIVSDSSYVVLGLQFPERARKVNNDLWDRMEEKAALHRWVQYRHVRGHVGITWNELADKLAVEARRKGGKVYA